MESYISRQKKYRNRFRTLALAGLAGLIGLISLNSDEIAEKSYQESRQILEEESNLFFNGSDEVTTYIFRKAGGKESRYVRIKRQGGSRYLDGVDFDNDGIWDHISSTKPYANYLPGEKGYYVLFSEEGEKYICDHTGFKGAPIEEGDIQSTLDEIEGYWNMGNKIGRTKRKKGSLVKRAFLRAFSLIGRDHEREISEVYQNRLEKRLPYLTYFSQEKSNLIRDQINDEPEKL